MIGSRQIKSLESFPDLSPPWVAQWQHAKTSAQTSQREARTLFTQRR